MAAEEGHELSGDIRAGVNEHRSRLFGDGDRTVAYVCECADTRCLASVKLTVDEYIDIRPGLILAPGHQGRAGLRLVEPPEADASDSDVPRRDSGAEKMG